VLLTHGTQPIRLVGFCVVAVGVAFFVLGVARLISAVRSRQQFRAAVSA
jgi:hypothetical protein